jgi:hypothetical protein
VLIETFGTTSGSIRLPDGVAVMITLTRAMADKFVRRFHERTVDVDIDASGQIKKRIVIEGFPHQKTDFLTG